MDSNMLEIQSHARSDSDEVLSLLRRLSLGRRRLFLPGMRAEGPAARAGPGASSTTGEEASSRDTALTPEKAAPAGAAAAAQAEEKPHGYQR